MQLWRRSAAHSDATRHNAHGQLLRCNAFMVTVIGSKYVVMFMIDMYLVLCTAGRAACPEDKPTSRGAGGSGSTAGGQQRS